MSADTPRGPVPAPFPEPREEAAVLHGDDGVIVGCTRAAAEVLGTTIPALLGQATLFPHLHVFDDAGRPVHPDTEPVWEALRRQAPVPVRTVRYWRADGAPAWIEVRCEPRAVRSADGVVAAVSVVRSVTGAHAPAARAHDSVAMEALGRRTARATHDFNNLLTVILGYSDLLLAELAEHGPLQQKALEIRNACTRGIQLTREMYAGSRELPGAPSVAEAIFPPAAVVSPAPAHQPAPCAVLLAVSDAPLRAFARQALEGAGCSVFEAGSGNEAREIAAGPGAGIDVLVADLALMAQSGAELRGAGTGERPAAQTIVLVGLHDVPRAPLTFRGARTELLAVPCRPDELLALVWTLTAGGPASKPGTA